MATRENRRQNRHPLPGRIKLHWSAPDGCTVHTMGECLDISKTGLRLRTERRIEPGLMVQVECAQFHIVGVAYARHCRAPGLRFVVGIEFAGGLTWEEPKSE